MQFLLVFNSLLIPTILGYYLIKIIFHKTILPAFSTLGLAYLTGLGILAQIMCWSAILKIPLSIMNLVPITILIIIVLIFIFFLKRRLFIKENPLKIIVSDPQKTNLFSKTVTSILLIYVLLNCFSIFVISTYFPIYAWDSITSEAFKAKMIFFDGNLDKIPSAPYPSFPLFTPFILSWSAMLTGFWEDGGMHIIFSLAFFSFISVFYNILSFYSNRYGGILGIILLLSSNYLFILATISYRDVFMMAYNSLTIFFLLLWEEKENLSLLIVAALMSGMGLFTKLEGQAYFFIHLFILGIILQERKDRTWKETLSLATCFIMTSLSFFLPFGIFKILSKTPFNEKAIVFIDHQTLFRFLETIKDTIKELLFFTNWHPLFWWLFSLCLIIFIIRKKDKTTSLLLTTIAFYFLTTIFVFSATNAYFEKVFCNISRVSLHFYPLIVLFIILIMKKTFSSYNKNL